MISRNAVHAAVRTPADHFETHSLRLRANQQRGGRWKAKYNLDVPYTLKIRVCDSCYQSDYLTAPDTLNADPTPLGRLARIQSIFMTIGAVIAGIGLVLLTPLAPDISFIGTLKGYWLAFTGAGLLVVLAAWLHQKARQKKLRGELTAKGIDLERLKRTEVRTPLLEREDDPAAIPLEIGFKDENWAQECAAHYQWAIETYSAGGLKGEE